MMSLTKAKIIAKNPNAYSNAELDDALTVIVEDDRLTEAQVTRMQAAIDPVLRARLDATFAAATPDCAHLPDRQSSDPSTNEALCLDCGWLRDLMTWEEWAKLPTESHLMPTPKEPTGKPSATRRSTK